MWYRKRIVWKASGEQRGKIGIEAVKKAFGEAGSMRA
jgi:hypothetical protein